jgi:hypothetical protein
MDINEFQRDDTSQEGSAEVRRDRATGNQSLETSSPTDIHSDEKVIVNNRLLKGRSTDMSDDSDFERREKDDRSR